MKFFKDVISTAILSVVVATVMTAFIVLITIIRDYSASR